MGTFYSNNDYRNYLMHYGVKGMKWGVRRFQNADSTLTKAGKARARKDGKGLGARMKIRAQGVGGYFKERGLALNRSRGGRQFVNNLIGPGAYAAQARNISYTQRRLAEASTSKRAKQRHDRKSRNAAEAERFYSYLGNSKNLKEFNDRYTEGFNHDINAIKNTIKGKKTRRRSWR